MIFLDDDGDRNRRPLRQSILLFLVGAPLLIAYLWATTWLGSLVCIEMGILDAAKPWFGNPTLALLSLFLGVCFEIAAVMICLGFTVAAVEVGDRVLHWRSLSDNDVLNDERDDEDSPKGRT
ncbi:MAG: hypothetical protein ABI142_07590 [Bryocella sp.]